MTFEERAADLLRTMKQEPESEWEITIADGLREAVIAAEWDIDLGGANEPEKEAKEGG